MEDTARKPVPFNGEILSEQIAVADRNRPHCFTPTTLQSPGGWAWRSAMINPMTKRTLIASVLQVIGVNLACEVFARAMSLYWLTGNGSGEMSADWTRMWTFNIAFWAVGLLFSITLIFFAAPIATRLSRIAGSGEEYEIRFDLITSDIVVQIFAGFLLVRQSYLAVIALVQEFQYYNLAFVRILPIGVNFAATIGASIWLLRCPHQLKRLGRSPENIEAEQDIAPNDR